MGSDVNLIHRLLKNSVTETTGFKAYAAYTQSAVEALRLDHIVADMAAHSERYEDIGEVNLHVKDMHRVWEDQRGEVRLRVEPEAALAELEAEFPVDVEELWRYVSHPHYRSLLHQSDSQHIEPLPDGEVGPGGVYVCAHGRELSRHLILDWQPPTTYTIQLATPVPGTTGRATYLLEPTEGGSLLRLLLGQAQGPLLPRLLASTMGRLRIPAVFRQGLRALKEAIKKDMERDEGAPAQESSRAESGS